MRSVVVLTVGLAVACGGEKAAPGPAADAGGAAARTPSPPEPTGPEPYPADVTSLRLKRSIVVRLEPHEDAKPLGTVAQDTRVGWTRVAHGKGCPRWVEIAPRGWVCDKYLEPTKKPPAGVELPKLKEGELVPGLYARVIAGGADAFKSVDDVKKKRPARRMVAAMKVRQVDHEVIADKLYWKTSAGELVEYAKLKILAPSSFVGVDLRADGAPALPFGWTQSKKDLRANVAVRSTPGGAAVRSLRARTVVPILETSGDGKWHRTDAGWIAAADLRVARPSPPPPTLGEGEKWFDVDLDEQVVVAWDGEHPAYATLTSSGSKKWPTAPGIYRIWIKFAETDMNGQMGDEDPYSVATVPWTMFFARDLAFHTAYWHDRFGEPHSHGCLNLSPKDARALYFWATPDVPAGWSMAHGVVERPGSMVRIRSAAVPEPEFMGYAKRVHEARLARAGGAAAPSAPGAAPEPEAEAVPEPPRVD